MLPNRTNDNKIGQSSNTSYLSPLTRRRLANFRSNKRGFWSLCIFLTFFTLTLFAEFLANDKPLLLSYDDEIYFPIFKRYKETEFGGIFEVEADYSEKEVQAMISESGGWMIWPPIPYSFDTIDYYLPGPAPYPPSDRKSTRLNSSHQ